jgi:hypothetical protein
VPHCGHDCLSDIDGFGFAMFIPTSEAKKSNCYRMLANALSLTAWTWLNLLKFLLPCA